MNTIAKVYVSVFILLTVILSCSGGKMDEKKIEYKSIKDIPESTWKKLSEKHIYFGHQSVGNNILDGIRDLMNEYPQIKLKIAETNNADDINFPVLAHTKIGKNFDPELKCSDFRNIIDNGIGNKIDIAFYKFCYVDVNSKTEVENIFKIYKETHYYVKHKYPDLKVIHVTIPLKSLQTGWKVSIKKILAMEIDGYVDNINRNFFNQKLIDEYGSKEPIYDLAAIESTRTDNKRVTFDMDGKTYYAMNPEYTYDGGHLNEVGRRVAAENLLILLVNLSI